MSDKDTTFLHREKVSCSSATSAFDSEGDLRTSQSTFHLTAPFNSGQHVQGLFAGIS